MKELLKGLLNRSRYERLLSMSQKLSATGETFRLHLVHVKPISKSGISSANAYAYVARVRGMGLEAEGVGTSTYSSVAIQKAISEAYERLVYRLCKGIFGWVNSSGMAAHPNFQTAFRNAKYEILERDATLVHWLMMRPFLRLDLGDHSLRSKEAISNLLVRSPILEVLFSTEGHISTLTILAKSPSGKHLVVAHGSGEDFGVAFARAQTELERILNIMHVLGSRGELGMLMHENPIFRHSIFPMEEIMDQRWMFGQLYGLKALENDWRNLNSVRDVEFETVELAASDLVVLRVSSRKIQSLFFLNEDGSVEPTMINRERVGTGILNTRRHFVS